MRLTAQQSDNAAISPDGTWIVFNFVAQPGIYVQRVSNETLPKQIASSGRAPVWRADGREILFYSGTKVSSIRVDGSGADLRFASPEPLFSVLLPLGDLGSTSRPLAVNHDGSRIYFLQSTQQPESGVIQVRTNAIR